MVGALGWAPLVAGMVAAALVAIGVALVWTGTRARREAAAAGALGRRVTAMLDAAPMQAMVVRVDGQVEMPRRLADWLGLAHPPRHLSDLSADGAGLSSEDAAALAADISAASRAGRPFSRPVRPLGSSRTLMLHGGRATPGAAPHGAAIVWAFDATDSETRARVAEGETGRLHAAFEALSGLIEAAPLPMWYRAPDLTLALVNHAYVAAVEGGDADGTVARQLELVEDGAGDGAAAARDAGRPHERTVPATIAGARRAMRVVDVPLPAGGVAGYAIDTEDLDRAQGRAKRFEEAQRAMLDRLSAGVAQFGADRGLVFCNQPFRRLFAMRAEWLRDRPEFDRVLDRMREAGRVPEVRDFPAWRAERRGWFAAADGGTEEHWHLPTGVHLHVVAQPLPDGGLLMVFEDRTEQVQLASARDTLLRVRTATFDNLFEALGVFSADGRLQLWNNRFRALWGFEEEFLNAHPRVATVAEAIAGRLANPARAALVAELVRSATAERQQRGGRVAFADGRHFEFAAVPLPDGNALFTMLDISDSRRIEQALRDRNEALEDADRVKTRFVANMSYELRTPLTSIGGFAEMLHGGYAGKLTREAEGYVEAILESTERLGVLVDDVLDLTAGDGPDAPLSREDVELAGVVRAAADRVAPSAKRRRVDFAVEVQRTLGRVSGDPRRLREVVEHLLRHALAAAGEGGRVLLHADGNGTRARVVVSDDGPGMDADAVAHAFDRFAQPGVGGGGGERALGLGLPLARQFAEAHGGGVTLVSEPGGGSLLTLELPRR